MDNNIFEDISQEETREENISEKLDLLQEIDELIYILSKKEKIMDGEIINE